MTYWPYFMTFMLQGHNASFEGDYVAYDAIPTAWIMNDNPHG
jgi:hypothetical protein